MCGIAGYVTACSDAQVNDTVLERMTDVLTHRGPDGYGYHRDERASLGHRRLSIIDVAAGVQPMYNEDRKVVIVYNGEVYNHSRLRPELEARGHRFATVCDTEAVLHAYEEYGVNAVEKLNGMFAFAIWDSSKKRLFVGRDRLGIKPFYYYYDGQVFVFGSEIKAVLEHPAVPRDLEQSVLPEYMAFGYVSEAQTMFRGVRELPPASTLTLDLSGDRWEMHEATYWEAPAIAPGGANELAESVRDCRSLIEDCVSARLMSDVPLGTFLSGGIDSAVIAAIMKRLRSAPVETFSVGYEEAAYSELHHARETADFIGSVHHEVTVSEVEFFDALPRLVWHEDEPIAWPSSIPLYFVSRAASERVKVVLTGEGSDEIFGGYERYRRNLNDQAISGVYQHVPAVIRARIRGIVARTSLLSADLRRKVQHTVVGRDINVESIYLDNYYCAFSHSELASLLTLPDVSPERVYGNSLSYLERQGSSPLGRLLLADQNTYLLELLHKQDRMSMAASVESRVPFLDHRLVEFAASLDDCLKISRGEAKYILKKAVEDLLPKQVVYRTKKGFPTPLKQWLRQGNSSAAVARLLQKKGSLLSDVVDGRAFEKLLDAHRSGKQDATDRIWRLLSLQIWGDISLLKRAPEAVGLDR